MRECLIQTTARSVAQSAPGPGRAIGWPGSFSRSRCWSPSAAVRRAGHGSGNTAFGPTNRCRRRKGNAARPRTSDAPFGVRRFIAPHSKRRLVEEQSAIKRFPLRFAPLSLGGSRRAGKIIASAKAHWKSGSVERSTCSVRRARSSASCGPGARGPPAGRRPATCCPGSGSAGASISRGSRPIRWALLRRMKLPNPPADQHALQVGRPQPGALQEDQRCPRGSPRWPIAARGRRAG